MNIIHVPPFIKLAVFAALLLVAPIKPALVCVMALPIADLVLALIVARRKKQPITSSGLKRTVAKILVYELAVLLAFFTEQFLTGDAVPALKYVTTLIGVTELKSLLEHMDSLSNGSFFKTIVDKLTPPGIKKDDNA